MGGRADDGHRDAERSALGGWGASIAGCEQSKGGGCAHAVDKVGGQVLHQRPEIVFPDRFVELDGGVHRPCPNDPQFPKFEDYDIQCMEENSEKLTVFRWTPFQRLLWRGPFI